MEEGKRVRERLPIKSWKDQGAKPWKGLIFGREKEAPLLGKEEERRERIEMDWACPCGGLLGKDEVKARLKQSFYLYI